MKIEELLRPHFRGITEERFQKAILIASKKVKPQKSRRQVFANIGIYNAVALNQIPRGLVSVKDDSKEKLTCWIIGQQVVCSRNFAPPVDVEYVTETEHARWYRDLLAAMNLAVKDK